MKALYLALILWTTLAFANENPQYVYQDGVLQGTHSERSAKNCIENISDSSSGMAADTHPCVDQFDIAYMVRAGGAVYILTPTGDTDETRCGLLIRSSIRHNVLANLPPNTPVKLRSDDKHFFVKIGDRESQYSVARIQ